MTPDLEKVPRALLDHLTTLLCYSALAGLFG